MTPLAHVTRAAEYFAGGGFAYHFDIPEGRKMANYTARIRAHARRLGYHWRTVHNIGRAWIIKQKVVK